MTHKHCGTCNMARINEKPGKWELHTVGPGVLRGNWKSWKMRNTHCRTWNMARNTAKGGK